MCFLKTRWNTPLYVYFKSRLAHTNKFYISYSIPIWIFSCVLFCFIYLKTRLKHLCVYAPNNNIWNILKIYSGVCFEKSCELRVNTTNFKTILNVFEWNVKYKTESSYSMHSSEYTSVCVCVYVLCNMYVRQFCIFPPSTNSWMVRHWLSVDSKEKHILSFAMFLSIRFVYLQLGVVLCLRRSRRHGRKFMVLDVYTSLIMGI